jgi:ferritin-like metal-binding protein YciE
MATIASFEELSLEGLRDIYSAETQLMETFPALIEAASSETLKDTFRQHRAQTRGQIARLEEIFHHRDESPEGVDCQVARRMLDEVRDYIAEMEPGSLRDAALIGAAQKFEHYEIAAYGTACPLIEHIGDATAVQLLYATLEEEELLEEKLTDIALNDIYPEAAQQTTPPNRTPTMMETRDSEPQPEAPPADSAMASGSDDEPEMTIADKHSGEIPPDPDGDGKLTVAEANRLLGGDKDTTTSK